ncbi:MAG: hypothetical protein JW816_00245 [Candidatus Buchananbacteria bacterium]|nr:hypothetical protein [Candidatus Buchananbacteria bacterium]
MFQKPSWETPIQWFLRQPIINTQFIYIDFWSIVHFCSGLIFGLIFAVYYKKNQAWLIVFCLLLIYEVFERLLDNILFVPESLVDKTWDIIIGMTGFFISYLNLKKIRNQKPAKQHKE